jgi:poly [ADP-ribose] polymerase
MCQKPTETPIKEVRLIFCDARGNNNKFHSSYLYANGDVFCQWGRVGGSGQSKLFPGAGEHFLEKKRRDKEKKGYTEQRTVGEAPGGGKSLAKESLRDLAMKQVVTADKAIRELLGYLVDSNIHSIISNSDITYNTDTGLFQTPLGIVTPDGLSEARTLLGKIENQLKTKGSRYIDAVNAYFRIIPQRVGQKFDPDKFVGTPELLKKQLELIEALEASYAALAQQKKAAATKKKDDKPEEQVFDLGMSILSPRTKEFKRIAKKFQDSKYSGHGCGRGVSVKAVYTIDHHPMRKEARVAAKRVGNVNEYWHGSNHANILSILQGGLHCAPPSTAAIAGKAFGNGLYFADCSTKALNYSTSYWTGRTFGKTFLFLADVAMGKVHVAKAAFEKFPKAGSDSTSGIAGETARLVNNEHITYKDDQVDLRYLVEIG